MGSVMNYTASQLATIRHTVAADTNDLEFDLFMNAARSYGLDPFRRQISAIVFNKNKPDKRRMTIIVGRDGLRSIAQRCGDYRPASKAPEYVFDDSAKGPTNPLGLVSASTELYKQDKSGEWFPVYGEAYWDEFAPLREIWEYSQESGKREPTGKFELDTSGQWGRMGRVMLLKCAEAQALRAGWPDVFSGLYAEEEMDQARTREATDITPSEEVKQEAIHRRQTALGKPGVMMVMDDSGKLERVPMGEVADRAMELIAGREPEEVYRWYERNLEPLREFWAHSPNDALEVKKAYERKVEKLTVGAAV